MDRPRLVAIQDISPPSAEQRSIGLFHFGDTMKYLPLQAGLLAIVDDDVYEQAKMFKWSVSRRSGNYQYPSRWKRTKLYGKNNKELIFLHRFIMNAEPGQIVDHANGNTLDCRRANLRFCTPSQNSQNSRKQHRETTSIYKGVGRNYKKWQARIKFHGRRIGLGRFVVEEDAARAYDAAAKRYFKRFARLNFPESK